MARKPHVLLIPYPAQGHITPLMQLGKRLSVMGVVATLVTLEHHAEKIGRAKEQAMQRNGVEEEEEGGAVEVVGVPDGLPATCERDVMGVELAEAVEKNMEDSVADFIQKLPTDGSGRPPLTCLIGDFWLSWLPHLAHRVNLPEVVFWPQCTSVFSVYSHVDLIISNGYNPFEDPANGYGECDPTQQVLNCVPGVLPVHPASLPFHGPFGKLGLQWVKNVFDHRFPNIHEAISVIGNSTHELEPEAAKALNKKLPILVGPLIPAMPFPYSNTEGLKQDMGSFSSLWVEDDCIQWLDMQPFSSVVYISFGSLTRYSMEQIHHLALGLAASQERFLWVVRNDTILEKTSNILEALPEGFLEETQKRGKIISWAPQSVVLSHPSIGGFFSHCGWNSVLESLSLKGVPILGWPYMMDQVFNCWLISDVWKIGMRLQGDDSNKVEKEEVERAVKLLMRGINVEDMRSRAKKLNALLCQALAKDVGSSFKSLESLSKFYPISSVALHLLKGKVWRIVSKFYPISSVALHLFKGIIRSLRLVIRSLRLVIEKKG